MSAGAFVYSTYAANYGAGASIHPIKVQPETIAATIGAAGNDDGGTLNNPISARVSGSRRGLGLFARLIRARLTGTAPDGYSANSVISIPALNVAFFTAAVKGAELDYLGTTWEITGTTVEEAK